MGGEKQTLGLKPRRKEWGLVKNPKKKPLLAALTLCTVGVLVVAGCAQEGRTLQTSVADGAAFQRAAQAGQVALTSHPGSNLTGRLVEAAGYADQGWDPQRDCLDCHRKFRYEPKDDLGFNHLSAEYHPATCLDCHKDSDPLRALHETEDTEGLVAPVAPAACESCHSGPWGPEHSEPTGMIVDMEGAPTNPHTLHPAELSDEVTCLSCHSGHGAPVDEGICYTCHNPVDFSVDRTKEA